MKKIKTIIFTLILFVIAPLGIYADCESDFKEIEEKFKVTYEYNYDTDDFTITLVNPDYKKYSYGFRSLEEFNATNPTLNDKDGSLTHTISGHKDTKYSYVITGVYEGCKQTFKQAEIELKKDNRFAYSPLCEGYEEFVLCQKDYDKEIDEETFKERLEIYKQTKAEEKEKEASEQEDKKTIKDVFNDIIEYVEEYLVNIIIAVVIIVVVIISIIVFVKRYIKRRRLE